MSDNQGPDWGEEHGGRAGPTWIEPEGTTPLHMRQERERARQRRRRRGMVRFVLILLIVGAGVAWLVKGFLDGRGPEPIPDYTGSGTSDVVVRVHEGDSGTDIAQSLLDSDVIKSVAAFMGAAHGRDELNAIQPGYYKVRAQVPAVAAVDMLTDPERRVGAFTIPEGRQLDDIVSTSGSVTPGIYTLLAEASCVELDGEQSCHEAGDFREAVASGSLDELGVPEWAREGVSAADDPGRRIEGLIAAGRWDIDPSATPMEIVNEMLVRSARMYDATGIEQTSQSIGVTPYEALIIASLLERESQPEDFAKVARVILNRLDIGMMLQFDSTVNYALDSVEIGTTDADRGRVTPWNTYAKLGLPQTPISSPSVEALKATENPEDGDWIYFVTIDLEGTTVFTSTFEEHQRQVDIASQNGVFSSGR
ncbi:endolytic transglycosylase MltG [Lolliginicoccus suaedae]|uniref:endolytic transglycosylase MltG n=1 Tax=Lolliginicoccus suaedae TaxID=2605429 RepID=UPI0011EF836F|nr:endolytic transglycosylase MltG [Lolliginicoccus suaedae]